MTAAELLARVIERTPEVASHANVLRARLDAGLASLRTRWPDAPTSPESDDAFTAYVVDRVAAQTELATALPRLRLDDLFLAWWAGTGDARGIAAFEAVFADDLRRLELRFHRVPADELRQRLRIKLFVGSDRAAPHIKGFSGFGFLQNWLKVTAVRAFVDVVRADDRKTDDELDADQLFDLAAPAGDPRDVHGRAELSDAIKRGFAAAVAGLAARERTFLRHAMVDRLTLEQIAATYQVHRATVARTLASAREHLLAGTRAAVVAILGIDPEELTSAIQMMDSRIELSLSRVLRASPS